MVKLIDKHYKGQCCQRIEEYLIDTDAELKDLPKAPAGSYAISVESGKKFFINSSGEWPDPSKYSGGGGGSTGGGGDIDALIDGSITEVTSNVETVNQYAFYCRTKLEKIHLPNVKSIGKYAFSGANLTGVKMTTADFPLVTKIEASVFQYCKSLQSVNMPLVTSLGIRAFDHCEALTAVDFPLVTSVDNYVFSYCKSLTSVSLPLLTKITTGLFEYCEALTAVDFPLVTSIAGGSFSKSSNLITLVLRSETVVTLSNVNAFTGTPFAIGGTGGTVVCKQHLIEQYKIETNWSTLYEGGTVTFIVLEGSEYE